MKLYKNTHRLSPKASNPTLMNRLFYDEEASNISNEQPMLMVIKIDMEMNKFT